MNSETLKIVRDTGARHGLNLVAAIPIDRYDNAVGAQMHARQFAPNARSIIVVGNGGRSFWSAFNAYADDRPGWRDREHPLDDFTSDVIEREVAAAVRARGLRCDVIYPFMNEGAMLNFMELAKLAGLAGPSILGVVVNPIYGPWIALRAALLVPEQIDEPGSALGFDPCPACSARTCVPACPAGAVNFPAGWDIPKCLRHRVEAEPDCAPRCHARAACVLGPEERYPDDELAYHQMRALKTMRAYYDSNVRKLRSE